MGTGRERGGASDAGASRTARTAGTDGRETPPRAPSSPPLALASLANPPALVLLRIRREEAARERHGVPPGDAAPHVVVRGESAGLAGGDERTSDVGVCDATGGGGGVGGQGAAAGRGSGAGVSAGRGG